MQAELLQPSVVVQLRGQLGSVLAQPEPGTHDQSQAHARAQSSDPRQAPLPSHATVHALAPHAMPAPQLGSNPPMVSKIGGVALEPLFPL